MNLAIDVVHARARLHRLIDGLAEQHGHEIRLRFAALRSSLRGKSYTRSLAQFRRWSKR